MPENDAGGHAAKRHLQRPPRHAKKVNQEEPVTAPYDPVEVARLVREAREDEPRPMLMRAVEIAVDAALGEVARKQGGIAIPTGREAREEGIAAGRTHLHATLRWIMSNMADQL
jgi:hypothetical protein